MYNLLGKFAVIWIFFVDTGLNKGFQGKKLEFKKKYYITSSTPARLLRIRIFWETKRFVIFDRFNQHLQHYSVVAYK